MRPSIMMALMWAISLLASTGPAFAPQRVDVELVKATPLQRMALKIIELEKRVDDQQDCWDRYEYLRVDVASNRSDLFTVDTLFRLVIEQQIQLAEMDRRLSEAGL